MEQILFNGYNFINTTIYTAIVFFAYLGFYKILKKTFPEIKIDQNFIYSILPFVLLGSLLRILQQENTGVWLIKHSNSPLEIGFYFHTPGWLLLIGTIFIFCFFLCAFLVKDKTKYYKFLLPLGIILCLPFLIYIASNIKNYRATLIIISVVFLIYFVLKKLKLKILVPLENKLVILGQTLDGIATITGLFFFNGLLYEQHPVSRQIISISPIIFPIIKLIFAFVFIIVVDKTIQNKEESTYIKLLVIILGFLTGMRNFFLLSVLIF